MGTTRTLADGEAFVQGRSQATAAKLVTAAAEADLKGSVRTTYDGYIAPAEVVEAAGFGSASSTESSTPENPADHSDEANAKYDGAAAAAQAASTGTEETPEEEESTEEESTEEEADLFDPTTKTIAEVEDYFDTADQAEIDRVIAAEKASAKPRKGVLDLAATQEGK